MCIRDMVSDDTEYVKRIFAQATEELRNIYRPKANDHKVSFIAEGESANKWRRRVVLHKGRVQGVVDYYNNNDQLFLRGLAVDPNSRRKGYARKLLSSLEESAKGLGLSWIILTKIQETGNVAFFRHLGYEVTKKSISEKYERVDMAAFATEVEMVKRV